MIFNGGMKLKSDVNDGIRFLLIIIEMGFAVGTSVKTGVG